MKKIILGLRTFMVVVFLYGAGYQASAQSATFYSEPNYGGKSVTVEVGKEHLSAFTSSEVKNTDYFLARSVKLEGATLVIRSFASLDLKEAGNSRPKWRVSKGGTTYSVVFTTDQDSSREITESENDADLKGHIQVVAIKD